MGDFRHWSNRTADRLALPVANLGSIPSKPFGPLDPQEVISAHRAMSKHKIPLGVSPQTIQNLDIFVLPFLHL